MTVFFIVWYRQPCSSHKKKLSDQCLTEFFAISSSMTLWSGSI